MEIAWKHVVNCRTQFSPAWSGSKVHNSLQSLSPDNIICCWQAKSKNPPDFKPLSGCHTKPRFHCVGTELFNFPESCEITRKPWYFTWKRASHGVLTVAMALLRSLHGALSCSYRVPLAILSALTMHAMHFHGVHTALTSQTDISKHANNLHANTTDNHSVCTTTLVSTLGAPIAM